jgi:hypothetical protein
MRAIVSYRDHARGVEFIDVPGGGWPGSAGYAGYALSPPEVEFLASITVERNQRRLVQRI